MNTASRKAAPGRALQLFAAASLAAGLTLGLAPTRVACAANLAVDDTADAVDANPGDGVCATGGGVCTLRAAIQEANALAGDDSIAVPPGSYALTIAGGREDAAATGDLDITSNLTIAGLEAASTLIDGGDLDRVFQIGLFALSPPVPPPPPPIVTISNVTIQNGTHIPELSVLGGGGIANAGVLTLSNSIVRDHFSACLGSAIYNEGTVILNDSIVSENVGEGRSCAGAALMNFSRSGRPSVMTLNRTTVSNNVGDGGILNDGGNVGATLTLNESTVSGNTGGVGAGTSGGITDFRGTTTLNNSTVSGNDTAVDGGGIFTCCGGTVILNNSTVSHNVAGGRGGGISNLSDSFAGSVILRNTIVAGNVASEAGADCSGPLTSAGYNLVGNSGDCTFAAAGGDQVGTSASPIDPMLGPLQDNGGPTLTHALLPGSPAIDAGNPAPPGGGGDACEAADQRGVTRPQGTTCDVGAFELVENEPPDCSAATADPATLWPPNHRLREIAILGVSDPDGDEAALWVDAILQDEPVVKTKSKKWRRNDGGEARRSERGHDDEVEDDDDRAGEGRTFPDADGLGTAVPRVRAERDGRGDGRVYHIQFTADDGAGGTCSSSVTVCVPRSRKRGGACGDQGPLFDSTGYGSVAAVGG